MQVSLGLVILCVFAAAFLTGIAFGLSEALRKKQGGLSREYAFELTGDLLSFGLFGSLAVALIILFGDSPNAPLIDTLVGGSTLGAVVGFVAAFLKIFGQIIGMALFGIADRVIAPEKQNQYKKPE